MIVTVKLSLIRNGRVSAALRCDVVRSGDDYTVDLDVDKGVHEDLALDAAEREQARTEAIDAYLLVTREQVLSARAQRRTGCALSRGERSALSRLRTAHDPLALRADTLRCHGVRLAPYHRAGHSFLAPRAS